MARVAHKRRVGYVQDERYIAGEHMDVRRDCVNRAQPLVVVGWVTCYPRGFPFPKDKRCVIKQRTLRDHAPI